MQQVSATLNIFFIIITAVTVLQFYRASKSRVFLVIVFVWMLIQLIIALTGFYLNEFTTPPRFMLLVMPPLIFIISLFFTKRGRQFIDGLNIKQLTVLHSTRIFVEIVLYFLFVAKTIPQVMTFEGRNYDIVAGLTAPVMYYIVFIKRIFSKTLLLGWNIIALILLINIVVIAILSLKTSFQRFGFEQPNVALTYFPFIWLPAVIVPLVLLSHFAALRQLIKQPKQQSVQECDATMFNY